jgi:hypothetical protein
MLGVAVFFAPGLCVALATWRRYADIGPWHRRPVCLVQVLADVDSSRMVGAVPLDRHWPVIRGPKNVDAGITRAGTPSAEPSEQINC